jgi:hypothetical protein
MYLQKVISRKNCVKNSFLAGILKVNDENSRIRIQYSDPDPLVRGMDPRIRIRIPTPKCHGSGTLVPEYYYKMLLLGTGIFLIQQTMFGLADSKGILTGILQQFQGTIRLD